VLHWFTRSKAEARRAVDMRCYFSVDAAMLTSERHMAMVGDIPVARLLTETDGPFTKTDGRVSKPSDVNVVVEALGRLRGMSSSGLVAIVQTCVACSIRAQSIMRDKFSSNR
jgi:TatD DNase family protein